MTVLPPKPRGRLPVRLEDQISPMESARYTADMLESLRRIAVSQGQTVLAHLLELSQAEARMAARQAVSSTS